jgi:hypothetical protein
VEKLKLFTSYCTLVNTSACTATSSHHEGIPSHPKMHHFECCTEVEDMKELKVIHCIEGGVEGSKNYGTLKGLNISRFNTAKTWDIF